MRGSVHVACPKLIFFASVEKWLSRLLFSLAPPLQPRASLCSVCGDDCDSVIAASVLVDIAAQLVTVTVHALCVDLGTRSQVRSHGYEIV